MNNGFTLVEILVSVLILGLLFAGIYAVLSVGNIIFREDMSLVGLQQQVRQAMANMTREIRQAIKATGQANSLVISSDGEHIDFYPPTYAQPISYYLQNNQIIREYPSGTNKIIAIDIDYLNFSHTGDIVEIKVRAKKTVHGRDLWFPAINLSLTEKVWLRN